MGLTHPVFTENTGPSTGLTADAFLAALSDLWSQPAPPPNTLYISKDTADRIRQAGRFWDIVQAIFGTKRPIPRDKWNKVRWPKQFGNTSWEYRCGPETTNWRKERS